MPRLHVYGLTAGITLAELGQNLCPSYEHVCCTVGIAQTIQEPKPSMYIGHNGLQPFANLHQNIYVNSLLHCSACVSKP